MIVAAISAVVLLGVTAVSVILAVVQGIEKKGEMNDDERKEMET